MIMHISICEKESFTDKGTQGTRTRVWTIQMFYAIAFGLALIFLPSTIANGQAPSRDIDITDIASGPVGGGAVWSATVTPPPPVNDEDAAPWVQLHFSDDVVLTGSSVLKITSMEDGHYQILDATSIVQWRHKSAFFNGDTVTVELRSHSEATSDQVVITKVTVDVPSIFSTSPLPGLCGTDDRELSTCLLYTSPSPRDQRGSRMPSSA